MGTNLATLNNHTGGIIDIDVDYENNLMISISETR